MIKLYKSIHYPASYYVASGYVPEFAQQILNAINTCEKESVYIEHIDMNENTYNWMFRIFNYPVNNNIYPLSSNINGKYLYDYPLNIVSNNIIDDGAIFFYTGENNGMA